MPALSNGENEVLGGAAHPIDGLVGAPCPLVAVGCSKLDANGIIGDIKAIDRVGEGERRYSQVGDPVQAGTSRMGYPQCVVDTCPCAQVSIRRAVAEEATLMSGPNHGILRLGSSASNAASRSVRAVTNQARISAGSEAR